MNKIKKLLPKNWLFKIVSITLTTTFTFYLFQYLVELEPMYYLLGLNEKNYIRSFLIVQVIVNGFFYVVLSHLIKLFFKKRIEQSLRNDYNTNLTYNDLKELSQIKSFLIRFFSLQIRRENLIDSASDLAHLEIIIDDKNKEINEITLALGKWSSLFIHLACTLIIVYHLSSWYILPLLIFILILIFFFALAASFVVHNIQFLEKVRVGLVNRVSK